MLIGFNLVWLVIPGVPFAGAVALLKRALFRAKRFRHCASTVSSRIAHVYAGTFSPGQWLQVRHGLALVGIRLGVSFSINMAGFNV